MAWKTEGIKTNPGAGALLAITDTLDVETHFITIMAASSVAAQLLLETRDGADSQTFESQVIALPASGSFGLSFQMQIGSDRRLRLTMRTGITGAVQASIIYDTASNPT